MLQGKKTGKTNVVPKIVGIQKLTFLKTPRHGIMRDRVSVAYGRFVSDLEEFVNLIKVKALKQIS